MNDKKKTTSELVPERNQVNQPFIPDRDLLQQLESMREKISAEQQAANDSRSMTLIEDSEKGAELLDYLTDIARDISRQRYGDPDEIFELTKTGTYPERICELAESFGMMIVKVEARELRLQQTIEKLKKLNEQLQNEFEKHYLIEQELKQNRDDLEEQIQERTKELQEANKLLNTEITVRKQIDQDRTKLVKELQETLDNIKSLKGLIPICSACKNIRNDSGYWSDLEDYLIRHCEIEFSHSLCPDCLQKLYPAEYKRVKDKNKIM
jgi:C4-dicarboxylate-specific signal transduction histidine kinase